MTASGSVLVGISDDPGYGPLKRFATEAAAVVALVSTSSRRTAVGDHDDWDHPPLSAMALLACRYHRRVAMESGTSETSLGPSISETATLSAAACMFRSLGDPTRLAILRHLSLGEHKVVDLTTHLALAQSTVSAHLACLRDCGLVAWRPQGRASMWSLNHAAEVLDVLAAAERLLAATGDAVALCPTYGRQANR